jgi:arylsulfatase A-like enzyme
VRGALTIILVLALAPGAACGTDGPASPPARRSVLLVTLDTTRADALSCYGGPEGTTPVLDALARESVLFERAYTPAPITLSAHASLLTGLYPLRHGLRDNGIAALDPAATTLAEAARAAGVQTAAFVGAVVLDRSLGLDQGFEHYDGPTLRRSTSGHPTERSAREVIDATLAWLEGRERARPFFAWVHLYDAHHPYAPRRALPEKSSERERYLAEVSEMDAELGRLFARLVAEDLWRETVVCVTSDHGEAFGEHGELTHGAFCWNTTLHVPLLLRYPDGARSARRVSELVSLVDVAPTLAEALGVALAPDIDGRAPLGARADADGLYFESYTGYLAFGWSPLAGWIDARGKYVHSSRPEFFDLARDPGEEHDLAERRSADLERHRAAIAALAQRPALVGLAAHGSLAPELRAGIQALGYAAVEPEEGAFPHPLAPSDRPSPHDRVGVWRESLLAKERMNRGRFEEAAEQLERLVALDPGNGFLRNELATARMRLKQYQAALDVLLPIAEAPPDGPAAPPQVFYKLGVCAAKLGRREEAVRHLERALELAPHEARFRAKLEELQSGAMSGGDDE